MIIFGNDFIGGDLEEEDESFARMVGDRRFLILGEETAMLDNEPQYHSQLIQSKLKSLFCLLTFLLISSSFKIP